METFQDSLYTARDRSSLWACHRQRAAHDRPAGYEDLIKIKNISISADLPGIRNALDACISQRDALAHGLWIDDPDYPNRLFLRQTAGNWTPPGKIGKHKRRIHPQAAEYVWRTPKAWSSLSMPLSKPFMIGKRKSTAR